MTDINITVDISKMTFGDWERMDSWGREGEAPPVSEVLDILDRVVEGGVRHLPITALGDIMEAIRKAVEKSANPSEVATGN